MTTKANHFFNNLLKKIQNRIKNYGLKKKYKSDLIFLFHISFCLFRFLFLCRSHSVNGSNYKNPGSFFCKQTFIQTKNPLTKQSVIDWDTPQRGDIIVFKYPIDESIPYTKRVIAVPGDKVKLLNKQVFVNGKQLQLTLVEEKTDHYLFEENLNGLTYKVKFSKHIELTDNMPEITVPEGKILCYG